MKRTLIAVLLLTAATALFAAMPAVGVTGTFHDLSYTSGYSVKITNAAASGVAANTLDQKCIWCHTPHHAIGSKNSEVAGEGIDKQLIPLWNHDSTDPTGFTMYNNTNNPLADLQGTTTAVGGISLACLSCHDGTLAMGAVRTAPYWAGTKVYTAGTGAAGFTAPHVDYTTGRMTTDAYGYVGTDLTNDHPISITYQDNLDLGLKAPGTFASPGVRLFGTGGNVTGNTVECGSCHEPHNYGTTGTTSPFLRYTMVGSALCLQCHNK